MAKYICIKCGKPTDNIERIDKSEFSWCDECQRRIDLEFEWEHTNKHWNENTIICPFCDYEYDEYTAYGYADDGSVEIECENCGKKIVVEVEKTVKFSTTRSVDEMPDDWDGSEVK